MTDHKFTDETIIKAVEHCFLKRECDGCPIERGESDASCIKDLRQSVPDILNRQKAKIESLQGALERADYYGLKADEEIEYLKVELDAMRGAANSYKMHYEEARAEAIKEFAKNIKKHFSQAELIEYIDSLVEETEMGLR